MGKGGGQRGGNRKQEAVNPFLLLQLLSLCLLAAKPNTGQLAKQRITW